MKEDPAFNIHFVSLVQLQPALYNSQNLLYNNRMAQDRAWEAIAKLVSEPVSECKERWKNLRACYTRHLKLKRLYQKGGKLKKPYYLADHLSFLHPFTKTRAKETAQRYSENEEFEDEDPARNSIKNEKEDAFEETPCSVQDNPGNYDEANEVEEFFREGQQVANQDEANLWFFRSLLPDLRGMSASQRRRFKIGILRLVEEILGENSVLSTTQLMP